MELGIFSRTYAPPDVDGIFAQIARDGFRAVQFNFSSAGLPSLPTDWPAAAIDAALTAAVRNGLTLCALSGTYNMAHPDAARRKAERVGFANVVRAAQALCVPLVTLCTGTRDTQNMWSAHSENGSPEAWSTLRAELDFALALAEHHDVTLGVEPEPANVVSDARVARRLLDEVATPRLGIIMDAANLLPPGNHHRQREVMAEAIDLLGADVALVHTKDVGANGEAVAAGRGVVDFHAFLTGIASTGYVGPLVSHNLPQADAAHAARYLRGVLEDIRS